MSLQSCPALCNPMDYSPLGFFVHRILKAQYSSVLPCPPPGDLPNLGIKPMSSAAPALQVDSLPVSHWGSPNYSLLLWKTFRVQWITFPVFGSDSSFLWLRKVVFQLHIHILLFHQQCICLWVSCIYYIFTNNIDLLKAVFVVWFFWSFPWLIL